MLKSFGLTVSALVMATSAFAGGHQISHGSLLLSEPVARATPPNAPVSAGYLTIENVGEADDRLLTVSTEFASVSQVHEMSMDGDIMRMREIEGGLELPAGETLVLQPGGLHLMFMQLSEALKVDEVRDVTLTFEQAGEITLPFTVERISTRPAKGSTSKNESKGSTTKVEMKPEGSTSKN